MAPPFGESTQLADVDEVLLGGEPAVALHGGQPGARRKRPLVGVLAGKEPCFEREVGDDPHLRSARSGDDLALDVPTQQVPVDLAGHEPGGARRLRRGRRLVKLHGAVVGAPGIADLARVHEFAQSLECFFHGRLRVGTVLIVQIDVVGTQPLQTYLAPLQDAPAQYPGPIRLLWRTRGELGRHHHLVAPTPQRPPQVLLGVPSSVDLGRVEVCHSRFERGRHHRPRSRLVQLHPEVVAAQAHQRHLRSRRADASALHLVLPQPWASRESWASVGRR